MEELPFTQLTARTETTALRDRVPARSNPSGGCPFSSVLRETQILVGQLQRYRFQCRALGQQRLWLGRAEAGDREVPVGTLTGVWKQKVLDNLTRAVMLLNAGISF